MNSTRLDQQNSNSRQFPSSTGSRWKWMAGSSAALGAGAAIAAPVQITQIGNELTLSNNNINPDLTKDTISDLPNLNFFQRSGVDSFTRYSILYYVFAARVAINSGTGSAATNAFAGARVGIASYYFKQTYTSGESRNNGPNFWYAYVGSSEAVNGSTSQDLSALLQLTFTDSRINNGEATFGFLEVRAFNTAVDSHVVQFVRLVFDDASTAAPGGIVAGGMNPEWVAPEPDINVLGNGNSIADGDTTPSVTDGTDFGSTQVGSTVVRTFTVVNEGTANLSVTSVVSSLGDFSFNFDNFGIGEFDVLFTPSSPGEQTATITIENDDPDEGTYTFDVVGVGTAIPVPNVAPATNPNAALQASFKNKIKKLKKKLKKVKASGNSGSAKKLKKKLKKLKKKLKAVS